MTYSITVPIWGGSAVVTLNVDGYSIQVRCMRHECEDTFQDITSPVRLSGVSKSGYTATVIAVNGEEYAILYIGNTYGRPLAWLPLPPIK